ncbi:MAG: hypothetical protein V4534_02265 [Myxococcota bacterium]
MLRLMLMRHANSPFGPPDHERTLSEVGRASVPLIAQQVADLDWLPELIYVSDAKRTLETCALFIKAFTPTPAVQQAHDLYQADAWGVVDFIARVNPVVQTFQIVGHNPTMEKTLEMLCGVRESFEPASIALLEHPGSSWSEAIEDEDSWNLIRFISAT